MKQGVAVIFISHALEEALQLADRITVLRDGELVVTGPAREFDRERLIQAMVGRSLSATLHGAAQRAPRPYGRRVLSVQNLSSGSMVRNTSFSIFAGQVTGIFGLVGAGRTETMKVVAGVIKRDFSTAATSDSTASRCAIACRGKRCATASSTSPKIASWRDSSRPCRSPGISRPATRRPASIRSKSCR